MAGLLPDPAVGVANSKAREGGELWGSPGVQPGRPEEGRVQFCGAATPHRGDLPESSRCDQDPPSPLPPPSPGVSGSLKVKRAPQFLKCSDFCIEVSLRYGWTHPQGDCYKQNIDQDDDDSAQGHTTNVFMKPGATGWIGLLTQTLPSSHWAGLRRLSLPTFKGSIYTNWSRNGAPPALCAVTAWPANCIWPLELE